MKSYIRLLTFFLIVIVCSIRCNNNSTEQKNKNSDNLHYDSIIKKISDLNHYDLKKYNELVVVNENVVDENVHVMIGPPKMDILIGWLTRKNNNQLCFLELSGTEICYKKEQVKSIRKLGIHDSIAKLLNEYCNDYFGKWYNLPCAVYEGNSNMPYYLVSLWEYQKGNKQLAYKLLKESNQTRLMDDIKVPLDIIIERHFGNYYYNLMLIAYSQDRDYSKAIKYGSYFNFPDFNNFYYTKTAIELTNQLKQRKNDFKSFRIPDSLTWVKLKNKMDRKEQFEYLIERLRLLNCQQWGQPGKIHFTEPQTSISYDSITGDISARSYWEKFTRYKVINPYSEILAMNPQISEIKSALPYLYDTSFIPTYWYWRDFYHTRKVYMLNEIVLDLINKITKEQFFDIKSFNDLTLEKKIQKIKEIRLWCIKNSR
jgi:hypothetical protein